MKAFSIVLEKYLNGKSIYTPIRNALNFIFLVSISSYFFQLYSGKYSWLNFNDYKGILDFVINGNFIVPLAIYLLVYISTSFISALVLPALLVRRSLKIHDKILGFSLNSEDIELKPEIEENLLIGENIKKYLIAPEWLISTYEIIRTSLRNILTLDEAINKINRATVEVQYWRFRAK